MKNLSTTIAILLTLVSCTKAQMITDLPEDINKPEESLSGATKAKRGVCQSTSTMDFGQRLVDLKANWYYTWGLEPSTSVSGVEFVPMFWGASSVTEANCDKINKLYEEGKIFYVLGFNEPDLKEESNMSVSDALDKWAFLCEHLDSRIKLVSPAPSYPTRTWLDEFMAGVKERGLRCDYVAVHMYAGIGTQNYQSVIREVYNKYGKKVWITEFAPRDDNAKNNGYNSYTEERVLSQMSTLLPAYEQMNEVFRYSWFGCASETMIGLISSRFFNSEGAITSLGSYYASINPNNEIYVK
ncbi:MAG: glycosyl hydrolase [Candidatus Cryptobacteroides sp.]